MRADSYRGVGASLWEYRLRIIGLSLTAYCYVEGEDSLQQVWSFDPVFPEDFLEDVVIVI